ncbi:MAG: hypothetical protein GY936_06410, partial [Ignavibacteriae bacterium]|nr:hypothetical protein [Ignavibacteriota bacterium]
TNIYGNYPQEIIRVDSISGVVYNNNFTKERMVDSLLAKINDTINSIYVADIYANNILGFETETKLCLPWGTSSYDWYSWEVSKYFGLTKMSHADGVALTKYEYELVYAKINGIEYGVYVG